MPATLAIRPAKGEVRPHRPAVRVRPVPPLEPPFDDERDPATVERAPVPLSVRAPELPLDLPARARARAPRPSAGTAPAGAAPAVNVPAGNLSAGDVRAARAAVAVAPGRVDSERAPATLSPALVTSSPATHARLALAAPASLAPNAAGPTATESTGAGPAPSTLDARRATRRFLSACLEVVGGYRPVGHLRPLCRADCYPLVAERLGGRRGNGQRNLGGARPQAIGGRTPSGSPPRAARGNSAAPGDRVGVLRVQVGEPREGVAEVAVVLTRRERVWAMAFRLEEHDGRWLCTHLEVL